MSYTKTVWVNGSTPAINATNLNKIEQGVYDNDQHIGDLNNLETTIKTNVVEAINELEGRFDYSTTEKVVGTWIDGDPLYKKIISFGALPNNTNKGVAHGISNLKKVIYLTGFAQSPLGGGITLPHATSYPVALYCNNTDVSVLTTNNKSEYTEAYIQIYYTKTTD